jgi:hypothetical protein
MYASLLTVGMFACALADVPVSTPDADCQLLAPSLEVSPGQEVEVPVSLKGAPGLAAMELDLAYDAAVLEPLGADLGPLGANALLEAGLRKPGVVILSLATAQAGPKGDGELLTVRFRAKGGAGQATPLQFKNVRAWRSDNELEIPLELVDGQLVVKSAFPWQWIVAAVLGAIVLLLAIAALTRRRPRGEATAPSGEAAAPATISCSKCGAPVAAGVKFCGQCGQAVPPPGAGKPGVCPKCGASVQPASKFCGDCGQPIAPG